MEALQFINVSKKFGGHEVLSNLNFVLKPNRIVGLLGPNGSGKTTIMKIIGKLIRPTGGQVVSDGTTKIKVQIEEPVFYKGLTGFENLRYLTADEVDVTKRNILDVAERLNMRQYLDKRVGKYSMGMRQKLAIAYMLLGSANVIVLDEPLNGLDPLAVIEVRNILRELRNERAVTVLISSHILKELQGLCDEIMILNEGEIVEHAEVASDRTMLEIEFETEADCEKGSRLIGAARTNPLTAQIEVAGGGLIADLVTRLVAAGLRVTGVKKKENLIEEMYCRCIAGGT